MSKPGCYTETSPGALLRSIIPAQNYDACAAFVMILLSYVGDTRVDLQCHHVRNQSVPLSYHLH